MSAQLELGIVRKDVLLAHPRREPTGRVVDGDAQPAHTLLATVRTGFEGMRLSNCGMANLGPSACPPQAASVSYHASTSYSLVAASASDATTGMQAAW